jgi:hypothetical protein
MFSGTSAVGTVYVPRLVCRGATEYSPGRKAGVNIARQRLHLPVLSIVEGRCFTRAKLSFVPSAGFRVDSFRIEI